MPSTSFQSVWLKRFGLSLQNWRGELDAHLKDRPFSDSKETKPLLLYLFATLPKLLEKDPSPETLHLAEAYGWACFAFWQCGSAFPSFPENHAAFLRDALKSTPKKRNPVAKTLAKLIVNISDGRCGFNQLALQNADLIRASEHLIHAGQYEEYLRATEKYDEYEQALASSPEFLADWKNLKDTFPAQTCGGEPLQRTLIQERNWERGVGAQFGNAVESFQALFDLFCWKYYLWGMKEDQPQLLKASVVFTPLGTQIFIPGYLSFDPKRDLDFGKISKLHRARGIQRQGKGFSEGRLETAKNKKLAKKADEEARKLGLKGDKRYAFVSQRLGILDHGDYRQIKRLLEGISPEHKTIVS